MGELYYVLNLAKEKNIIHVLQQVYKAVLRIKVALCAYILGLPGQHFSKKNASVMVIAAFWRWGRAHVKLPLSTEVYATNTGLLLCVTCF